MSVRLPRRPILKSARCFTTTPRNFRPLPTAPSLATPSRGIYHPSTSSVFTPLDTFLPRHLGPREADVDEMLRVLGYKTMNEFVDDTIPSGVRIPELSNEDDGGLRPLSELELRRRAEEVAAMNKGMKSYIGMG